MQPAPRTLFHAPVLAALAAAALTACGGGGGADAAPGGGTAEGAYAGTATRTITANPQPVVIANDLQLLVLDDGTFWALYGFVVAGEQRIAGFVTGRGASSGGRFQAGSTLDYGLTPPAPGTLDATYTTRTVLRGTVADSAGNIALDGGAVSSTLYDYQAAASLAAVQGSWTMRDLLGFATTLTIAANGSFGGAGNGCSFTGTLTPAVNGRNVFVATLTLGAAPCAAPGQVSTGIGVLSGLSDGRRRLAIVGAIPARTYGVGLVGAR